MTFFFLNPTFFICMTWKNNVLSLFCIGCTLAGAAVVLGRNLVAALQGEGQLLIFGSQRDGL
jgi:hypothetical protein